MKNCQIVDILNVTFLEIQRQAKSISKKMKCIEGFGLRFSDWWYVFTSREMKEAGEASAGILNDDSFWRRFICWGVEKKGP